MPSDPGRHRPMNTMNAVEMLAIRSSFCPGVIWTLPTNTENVSIAAPRLNIWPMSFIVPNMPGIYCRYRRNKKPTANVSIRYFAERHYEYGRG